MVGDNNLFNNKSFNAAMFEHPEHNGGPNAAVDALKRDINMKHKILREFELYAEEKMDLGTMKTGKLPSAGSSHNISQTSDGT
jgi:hypothetical protein